MTHESIYGPCLDLSFQILIVFKIAEKKVKFINSFIDIPFWQFLISKKACFDARVKQIPCFYP